MSKKLNVNNIANDLTKTRSGYLNSFFKKMFFKKLNNIENGYIEIDIDNKVQSFGDKKSNDKARIKILSQDFFSLLGSGGLNGAAEAYSLGLWECEEVVVLIRIIAKNKKLMTSFETGIAKVFIQDISSGEREAVLSKDTQISSPSWSPDGKYLSLTLYQDGNAEIYILRLKDRALTRMTKQYAIDTESSWSPKGNKILFTSGRSGSPQIYELDLRKLNPKAKRLSFEGTYNAKASYLPKEEGIIFVHRADDGLFHIALKYKRENFIRILTEAKMDESPSVAPNGNMVIYGIKEGDSSMLAGFSLSGARFKLPASIGEVREPAWSNFLR